MTNVGRGAKPRTKVPQGELKKPRGVRFVTVMAFVLPGSGQVFNGAPTRGIIMQFAMVFGAYLTYMLSTPAISPIGRMAGGLLVYVFSILDAHGIATLRVKAWERIEAEQVRKADTAAKPDTVCKTHTGGARKRGVKRPSGRKSLPAASDGSAASEDGAIGTPASPTGLSGVPAGHDQARGARCL